MPTVERILPLAQKHLLVIGDDAPLMEAARLLGDREHNLVVVCDDTGALTGIITKTDIVGRIGNCTGSNCMMAAASAMTREITVCQPADRLRDIWTVIKAHSFKNIPVVDKDRKPLGVLNARDVLEILLEDVQHEEHLLREFVFGIGYR